MLEWSDDDKDPVAPPLSTQAPPSSTHMEEQPRGSEEVPEHQATEVPARQATGVPEQQTKQRPTMEEARPLPQDKGVDPAAALGGSGRHRQFKKLHRQTKR